MARVSIAAWSLAVTIALAHTSAACPFCTAVKPSLGQRIATARKAGLVEVTRVTDEEIAGEVKLSLPAMTPLPAPGRVQLPRQAAAGHVRPGQLALVVEGGGDGAEPSWELVPLDEVGFAYLAQAPARRLPAAQRLPYYARFLEHSQPLIAEDAYLEFGAASFEQVAEVADRLPMANLRRWIVDPQIPESRKGFYGLALGLARTEMDRRANRAVLEQLIDAPADDFRAGFDGVLGGYLYLTGKAGLARLENTLFANPQARVGDLRHAATALRFMHEFGGEVIPRSEISRAMRALLQRPELAAAAIVDLARWQDWQALTLVAPLFEKKDFADPATSRAIVGYLAICPRPEAAAALAKCRQLDPQRVSAAEQAGLLLTPRQ